MDGEGRDRLQRMRVGRKWKESTTFGQTFGCAATRLDEREEVHRSMTNRWFFDKLRKHVDYFKKEFQFYLSTGCAIFTWRFANGSSTSPVRHYRFYTFFLLGVFMLGSRWKRCKGIRTIRSRVNSAGCMFFVYFCAIYSSFMPIERTEEICSKSFPFWQAA